MRVNVIAVLLGASGLGCQIDPGNYIAYQFYSDKARVATIFVDETPEHVTTEHWVFDESARYDPARGVDTVPSSTGPADLRAFKDQMCSGRPGKYLTVATTEFPLDCAHPAQPKVATPPDSILGDGSYVVTQNGREVGTVFVENKVEHWAVITGTFRRAAGFFARPRPRLTYDTWAAYACSQYNPRTYWVVTSSLPGALCP